MSRIDPKLLEENQAILDDIAERGSDLAQAREVDFEHLFDNRMGARDFARLIEAKGYRVEFRDRDDGKWDVRASLLLIPTVEAISAIEQRLGNEAASFGGKADGWGFFSSSS